jgi:hypothetical protein
LCHSVFLRGGGGRDTNGRDDHADSYELLPFDHNIYTHGETSNFFPESGNL